MRHLRLTLLVLVIGMTALWTPPTSTGHGGGLVTAADGVPTIWPT